MNFGRKRESGNGDASAASREESSFNYLEQQQQDPIEQKLWMDAAYRRLGQRLSQSLQTAPTAASEQYYEQHPQNLGHAFRSAFSEYNPQLSNISPDQYYQRWNYGAQQNSILKNMTVKSNTLFQLVEKSASSTKSRQPSGGQSAISTAFREEDNSTCSSGSNSTNNISARKGLLQSVLESQPAQDHRKCLSRPSEPVANGGMDNSEGNLICYECDLIQPSSLHTLNNRREDGRRIGRLRVLELLGQGTFAQVFGVECVETGERFALKVVKNKQAYARQATIEIDVFRALANCKKRLIELEAYFVYANHLCLLFEWLGPNLYEVLKQRQFRGLPLEIVRCLLKQALEGLQELGNKSIIHCDVKPENILCVSASLTDENIQEVICQTKAGAREKSQLHQLGRSNNQDAQESQKGREMTQTQRIKEFEGKRKSEQRLTESLLGVSAEDRRHMPSLVGASDGVSETVSSLSGTSLTYNTTTTNTTFSNYNREENKLVRLKLIDFGSASFESSTSHNPEEQHKYIQSRFYRSPEVLLGLGYDSAIDMWSLGCVAAELFLGLPILPGNQEHDQIGRIVEMMGSIPDWMLEQGTKARTFFVKEEQDGTPSQIHPNHPSDDNNAQCSPSLRQNGKWRLKTASEYLQSMSQSELAKRGGKASLVALAQEQKQHRYFEYTELSDIILHYGKQRINKDDENEKGILEWFAHLLSGMLDPDPWKRLTANQASCHPFFKETKSKSTVGTKDDDIKDNNSAKKNTSPGEASGEGKSWVPPWDPSICRRKLLFVQRVRERQRQRQQAEEKSQFPKSGISGSASYTPKTSMNTSHAVSSLRSGDVSITSADRAPSSPSALLSSLSFHNTSTENSLASSSFVATRTHRSQQEETIPSSLRFSTGNNPPSALSLGSAFQSRSYNANSTMTQAMLDQTPGPTTEFGYAISRPTGGVLPPHHHLSNSYQQQIPGELHLSVNSFPSSGMSSLHTTDQGQLSNSATLPLPDSNTARNPMDIQEHRHLSQHSSINTRMPPQPFISKSHSYNQNYNSSISQQEMSAANSTWISPSLLALQLEKQKKTQQQHHQQQWIHSQQRCAQQLSISAGADYYDVPSGGGYVNEQQLNQYYHTERRYLHPSASAYQKQAAYSNPYNGQPQQHLLQHRRRPQQFQQH